MALSLRNRLALWSSLVTMLVLSSAALGLTSLYGRQALARLDESLWAGLLTADGVMRNELDEGHDLQVAARDAMSKLDLPGTLLMVLDGRGQALGMRASGVRDVPGNQLATARSSAETVDWGEPARIRAFERAYRGHRYRIVVWKPLAALHADRAAMLRAIGLTIPIAVILAAAGGWLLAWHSLRPLSRMALQADRMTHRRLDVRLDVGRTGDEMAILGAAFNSLLDRLAGALREQRAFMADASHQLRTPVSIARTAADVTLARSERSGEEYREALGIIALQMQRMTRIVDDMFALALADAGARPLQRRLVDIEDLIAGCVKAARVLARPREIVIQASVAPDCQVTGDEDLLTQMVLNLLENAVRHSPGGGFVDVEALCQEDELVLSVQDSGRGIAESDRDRVFERFVRLESVAGERGGGLGLPIARWIAELHGGSLGIAASDEQGTRFEARLPIAVA